MDAKSDDSAGSDSLDKSLQKKCVVDDAAEGSATEGRQHQRGAEIASSSSRHAAGDNHDQNSSFTKHQRSKTEKMAEPAVSKSNSDSPAACSSEGSECSKSPKVAANTSSSNNNAFETKVTQISKNLKETTLAESASSEGDAKKSSPTTDTLSAPADSSPSSSSSSSSTTPESEIHVAPSAFAQHVAVEDDAASVHTADLDGSMLSTSGVSDSNDEHDGRSKKVRFHPDVKENDGGNRIIPKKKKKLKATSGTGEDAASCSQQSQGADDEMDLDEEEECEEEDEFDLAKTIAEAQDYLKEHPLTFVRPCDKNAGLLQNGLLEEEDLPQLSESSEDEDFYEHILPENGVERILGKQNKCGKVEFLLRYVDKAELTWENEDVINKLCPNLLNKYEQHRERRQERLMRHVAKRQNLRQRYTDF